MKDLRHDCVSYWALSPDQYDVEKDGLGSVWQKLETLTQEARAASWTAKAETIFAICAKA